MGSVLRHMISVSPLQPLHAGMMQYRLRRVVRSILLTSIWAISALFLGALIGLAAVVLPPMGAFGIVGLATLILLFVAPADDRLKPPLGLTRISLVVALVINICAPNYYAFSLPGLPWLSFHRLTLFPLVILTSVTLAVSAEARRHILDICRKSYVLSGLAACYALAAFFSIFFSHSAGTSASRFSSLVLEWYLPAVAMLLVVRSERDIERLVKTICYCAIFVCLIGAIDFYKHQNTLFLLMPSWMYAALAEANASMAMLMRAPELRNGMYRASSVYGSPLSFGEFSGLMLPFGYYFIAYGRRFGEKYFGALFTLCMIVGIVASGSRGGYMMLFTGSAVFFVLWLIREVRTAPRSLAAAISVVALTPFVFIVVGAVLFWPRAHNLVLGGGMEQYSTDSRSQEWYAAIPHILHNPVFGNGFGIGADVVGFQYPGSPVATLDSSLISVFVETGIIGLASFFGTIVVAILLSMTMFVSKPNPSSALLGATAASLAGFLVYRTVLSQMDNQLMFFLIVALVTLLREQTAKQDASEPAFAPSRPEPGRDREKALIVGPISR